MGSIYKSTKTRKDGTHREVWTIDYVDIFGKRKRQDFKTKSEAYNELKKIEDEIENGNYAQRDKTLTFEKAAKEYMELHAEIYCKPATIKAYFCHINCHLKPAFGSMKLIDITPKAIEKFIQARKEGLSAKSINNCIILLGSILQRALNNGQIGQNPVSKIRRLSLPHQEMRILTIDEIEQVLDIAKKYYPNFYPLLLMAIMTGMRRGELLGLTWDRINWETKKIYVTKSLYRNILIEPKTPASIRETIAQANNLQEFDLICHIFQNIYLFLSRIKRKLA
ncbi:MAG: tyrosine-type recombinase/integrase [Candidatus Gastranaerophilales bacterium]|nr:tyrosine-type recombinase/integrase [Candidatus Gastranaerophilales bacterium]